MPIPDGKATPRKGQSGAQAPLISSVNHFVLKMGNRLRRRKPLDAAVEIAAMPKGLEDDPSNRVRGRIVNLSESGALAALPRIVLEEIDITSEQEPRPFLEIRIDPDNSDAAPITALGVVAWHEPISRGPGELSHLCGLRFVKLFTEDRANLKRLIAAS